jgi:tetratricopeptide (TPR) repeat protein
MREKARATLVPSLRPQSIRNLGEVALSANGSTAMFAMLVEMCLDDGDIPAAEDWLAKLLEVAPNGALTLRLVAKVALVKGDSETVAGVLKTLLPDVPVTEANASRMVPAARVVEDLGFPEEAGRVFAKCAELSTDGVLLHAQSLGRRHRTKEAIALAESVRAEVSPQSFLDTLLAISRYSDADPDSDAVADIERIAGSLRRENPGVPGVAFSAAVLEDAFGRTSRAMKGYRDLLASTDVEAGLRAVISANLAFDIAHPETADEATKLIDAAVAEMGPTTDLLDSRSMVRLARGQTRQALEDVSDAILLQPSPRNLLHLALIRTEMSDLDGAREALAEAERKGLAEERLSPDDRRRLAKVAAAIEGKK